MGEGRELQPLQRSLLCPDLNISPPLDVQVGVVAPPQQESPGRDTVLAVGPLTQGTLCQAIRAPGRHEADHREDE